MMNTRTAPHGTGTANKYDGTDPKRFVPEVMNDSTAELRLRIETAKALLPYFEGEFRDKLSDNLSGHYVNYARQY